MTYSPSQPQNSPKDFSVYPMRLLPKMNQFLKLFFELGPLVIFFVVNGNYGIFPGTAAFMIAAAIAIPTMWIIGRQIPIMPIVSGVFLLAFGGLTLYLQDETFIKIKPTLVNILFAIILWSGLLFRTSLLRHLFGSVLKLSDIGWRSLTIRWSFFFVVLALLNEAVWRTQTTELWIQFKLFGVLPLTILFSATQLPLINRHKID